MFQKKRFFSFFIFYFLWDEVLTQLIARPSIYPLKTIAEDYVNTENKLQTSTLSQLILRERGVLLDEVYQVHRRFLRGDFRSHNTIWSLGVQRQEKLIANILSINANRRNLNLYVANNEFAKVVELASDTLDQQKQTASDYYQYISDKSFWQNVIAQTRQSQCNAPTSTSLSQNQIVFNLYDELAAVQLKSYINIQFCSFVSQLSQNDTFEATLNDNRRKFLTEFAELQAIVGESMKHAERKKWNCHKSNYSNVYHQITRFIQGYVDNEVNLNQDASCKHTCSDHKQTKNFNCKSDTLCAENHIDLASTKCNGTVLNCEFIGDDLTACPSQKLNTRRYDFIEYTNGRILGKKDACLQSVQSSSWTSWFVDCSNCFCYCDEMSDLSDRFFSLHDVKSNIDQNRVVTGVSIRKRNRMIEFVITESELLPFGKVNTEFATESGEVESGRFLSNQEFQIHDAGIKDGVNYFTLTYEHRSLNLDAVVAPPGKLLTGIRFHVTDDQHLTIQIRATNFNFETGKLENLEESVWLSSDDTEHSKLELIKPDIPTRTTTALEPDWTPNYFVEFGPTDKEKDGAQTTVPFIDGTLIEGKPTILSGAGLFFKGQPGSGGFIAPYLINFDYSSQIKPLEVQ